MSVSRRNFLWLSLGLMAAGCSSQEKLSDRPGPEWPEDVNRPRPLPGGGYSVRPQAYSPRPFPSPSVAEVTPPPYSSGPTTTSGPLQAIPRSHWTRSAPIMTKINPMDGVSRITVHHEGWRPFYATDMVTTAQQIEIDRSGHVNDRHWGDIAYHYIVDRQGRLWQGRDVRYQGAHVEGENEHNVGVMCLGNFDLQLPSAPQLSTLQDTLTKLMRHYEVPVRKVYTHQELGHTRCPGVGLQPRVVAMRRGPLAHVA